MKRSPCLDVAEGASEYLDGRMSIWGRLRFRWHVAMCGWCHGLVGDVRQVVDGLRKMPPKELSARCRSEILKAAREKKAAG